MKKIGRKAEKTTSPKLKSYLLALEPRMMFDGAIVATTTDIFLPSIIDQPLTADIHQWIVEARPDFAADIDQFGSSDLMRAQEASIDENNSIDRYFVDDAEQTAEAENLLLPRDEASNTSINSLIFIDTAVTGYDQLVAEWQVRGTIVLIDSSRDGVEQILTALAGRTNVSAIHIVSHGVEGEFNLGTTRVNLNSLIGELASSFAAIGAHLSSDADILLYGCDIGSGQAGQDLLDALAATTGADIAASTDDTGYTLRGGNWILENRLGVVENAVLVAQDWQGPACASHPLSQFNNDCAAGF